MKKLVALAGLLVLAGALGVVVASRGSDTLSPPESHAVQRQTNPSTCGSSCERLSCDGHDHACMAAECGPVGTAQRWPTGAVSLTSCGHGSGRGAARRLSVRVDESPTWARNPTASPAVRRSTRATHSSTSS